MSRSSAKPPGAAPPRSKGGAQRVGSRSFQRRAQSTKRQTARKPTKPRVARTWPSPREALRSVPLAAWLCALVACLNAAAWSVITPPFQVPDEPEHVAYVNQLVKKGSLPTKHYDLFSAEENVALVDLQLQSVAEEPQRRTISSKAQEEALDNGLNQAAKSSETGSEGAGVATSQPPLYYAIEAIPFSLAGGTLLDRIELMRLLSALMGGLTALFSFLFLRELLPRVRWAWTVGGLGVALAPLLGFMSGAVNPEAMLYTVTAALFYALARGFRSGITRSHAITIGAVVAIGFATKLNFIGIAPGVLLGLIVLSIRAAKTLGRAAYISLAIALLVAFSPILLYMAVHLFTGGHTLGLVSAGISSIHGPGRELVYIWQFYLPRLPGMHNYFAGVSTSLFWFKGYVGLYGWLDTPFPAWVYDAALIFALLLAGLAIRALVESAAALRGRIVEIVVYGVMVLGLMTLVGAASYEVLPRATTEFAQTRYLLPLIPLLGVVYALAARGAGRRWGSVVGAAMIMIFLGHDIFSQLQEVARYYG
jgi:hypothetical protein